MSLMKHPDTGHLVGIEQQPHPVVEFQEYPKAVYRGDICRHVNNADEEAAAVNDGFGDHPPGYVEPDIPEMPKPVLDPKLSRGEYGDA